MSASELPFPAKRVSVGALIRNQDGEILVVKPAYRNGWLVPGGICEPDESPRTTLVREIHEELGIEVRGARLICIDYVARQDVYAESVHFLFECDALTRDAVALIRLPADELLEFRFCSDIVAEELLVTTISRRLACLREANGAEATIYLENGICAGA